MRKFTQHALTAMIRHGQAVDCNDCTDQDKADIISREEHLTRVGYSVGYINAGVYGVNGGLWRGHRTGKLYAITDPGRAVTFA